MFETGRVVIKVGANCCDDVVIEPLRYDLRGLISSCFVYQMKLGLMQDGSSPGSLEDCLILKTAF